MRRLAALGAVLLLLLLPRASADSPWAKAGTHLSVLPLTHAQLDLVQALYPALLAGAGNRACSLRGLGQSIETNRVAVGEAGFLAGLGAYANALIEVETAFLDDAILKNPGFRDLALEVQISGIDAGTCDLTQHGT